MHILEVLNTHLYMIVKRKAVCHRLTFRRILFNPEKGNICQQTMCNLGATNVSTCWKCHAIRKKLNRSKKIRKWFYNPIKEPRHTII